MNMKKILLIDGHSMLNRAFYGVPPLTNSKGVHTNAVFGFFNIMFSVMDDEKPDHLAVAFDLSAPTFRHKIYDAYKGTRKPMPPELKEQIPLVKQMLAVMEIPVVTKEGFEADDILGTLAGRAESEGFDVCILSGDRDLLQLATDRIKIRMPHTRAGKTTVEDFYAADVKKKYGVTPSGIIELKALMGDASDNIPGVPKIGEKTALQLITEYGCIENLKEHREEITKNSIRQTLTDNFDMAELSKVLATIDTKADIDFSPDEAVIGDIYTAGAYELASELELRSFMSRFDEDVARKQTEGCEFVTTAPGDEARKAFEEAKKAGSVVVLTKGSDKRTLDKAALCFSPDKVYEIDASSDREGVSLLVKDLLADEKVRVITHDLKNLLRLTGAGEDLEWRTGVYDMLIMSYLVNPLAGNYETEHSEIAPAALECFVKFEELLERVREQGMEKLMLDTEFPLIFTLYRMEETGVLVKKEELASYGESLKGRIDELEEKIYEGAGERFNINSPKQLGVILFEKLSLPGGKKTKTGYSTAADVLEKLAADNPLVAQILEYRALTKLNSTYAQGLAAFIEEDGRIRSSFNQTVTATGRLSSSDPNLQNIPVRTELGRQLRKVFVPKEGCVFVDADYSQIELRILASMSKDDRLIAAYGQDQDIHRITASQVFHVPLEAVTAQQRRNAKAVNFGIVYGISSFGLSRDLSITREEAAKYIKDYYITYPQIEAFLKKQVEDAKETGYVTTLYGRRRPVPELTAGNFMQRQFGERVAMNAPIQGTAADIMKFAMLGVERALREKGLKARIVLQVHDELLIETPENEKTDVIEILKREMEGAASLPVKLETEVKFGNNWYDAH
ncbi:MAG: DNA polymerase I [Lachnospiraceae bacterium]|nr:DNA polymerase I [Lachnospiraceae bacterium]